VWVAFKNGNENSFRSDILSGIKFESQMLGKRAWITIIAISKQNKTKQKKQQFFVCELQIKVEINLLIMYSVKPEFGDQINKSLECETEDQTSKIKVQSGKVWRDLVS